MTFGRATVSALSLVTLVTACNSSLVADPVGLRCDPSRSPPCTNGFVCIDGICVPPGGSNDGGATRTSSETHTALTDPSPGDGGSTSSSDETLGPTRSDPVARPVATGLTSAPDSMASSDTQPNVSAADAGYRPQSDALRDAGVPNTDDAAHDAGETLVPGPNTEVTSAPDPTTFTPEPQAPCSVACEAPEHGTAQCDGAVCSVVCDSEFEWCTDRCVDTQTSVSDCGSCGVPCPTGHVCVGGECALDCQNGTEQCSGACVDTAHDVENCGECGTKCEARGSGSPVCNDGRCERDCGNGKTDCDGECVDLSKDEDNCGTCGNYCLLGKCADGECSLLGL